MKRLVLILVIIFAIASVTRAQHAGSVHTLLPVVKDSCVAVLQQNAAPCTAVQLRAEHTAYRVSALLQAIPGFEDLSLENQPQHVGANAFANDLIVSPVLGPTVLPTSQLVPLTAQVSNVGTAAQTNVRLSAIRAGTNLGQSVALPTLDAGAAAMMTVTPAINPNLGPNNVTFTVTQNETDQSPGNNTATRTFLGTDHVLAMDLDVHNWVLSNPNCVGNVFPITANTELHQIHWVTNNVTGAGAGGIGGAEYTISLFRMDEEEQRPITPAVFTTDTLIRPVAIGNHWVHAGVPPTALVAGNSYFVCVTPAGGPGVRIFANQGTYTDQGRVFNVGTGEFQTINEAHTGSGGTNGNAGAYILRMVVDLPESHTEFMTSSPFMVTHIPLSQAAGIVANHPFPRTITANALNFGVATQTNLRFSATFGGTDLGTSSTIASLPSGANVPMTLTQDVVVGYPTTAGTFDLVLTLEQDGTGPIENEVSTFPLNVGSVFAFDTMDLSVRQFGGLGGGPGFGVGNVFPISYPTTLTHVEIGFAESPTAQGNRFSVSVHRMSTSMNRIVAPLAITDTLVRPLGGRMVVELPTPVVLLPGVSYFISVNEITGQNIQIVFDERPSSMRTRNVQTPAAIQVVTQPGFGAPAVRMVVDDNLTLPPVLISTVPRHNTRDIAVDSDIVLTFHEANLVEGDFSLITFNPAVVGVSARVVDNQLVISHDGLAFSTQYTLTIPAGTVRGFNDAVTIGFRSMGNCQPIGIFPWLASFDATFFHPDCWRVVRENPAATGHWQRNTAAPRPGTVAHVRHTNSLPDEGSPTGWLITPTLEIPATGIHELNFWTRWQLFAGMGRTEVWVSTDGYNTEDFVKLAAISPTPRSIPGISVDAWEERSVSLEQFAGQTIYLAFRSQGPGFGTMGSPWDISGIAVQRAPIRIISTTPADGHPDVATNQTITATFNQDVTGANLHDITISPAVSGFSAAFTGNRTLTITHSGLDNGTIYTVTIAPGAIEGLRETISFAFRTVPACPTITTLPWRENFAPVAGFPAFFPMDCWTVYDEDKTDPSSWERNTGFLRPGTTHHVRHGNPFASSGPQTGWLISPRIAIPAEDVHDLHFWTRWTNNANNGHTSVWVSTTTNAIDQFTELHEVVAPQDLLAWIEQTVSLADFAGQNIYLAFRFVSREVGLANTAWYISDLTLAQRPVLILAKDPVSNAADVAHNTDVRVTFNQPITLLNSAGITFDPPVAGVSATVEDDHILVITTTGNFEPSTLYRITLANNVIANFDGASWAFTTPFPMPDLSDPFDWNVDVVADNATITWAHGTFTTAAVTLKAGDTWGDGSGYQMLLDNTAALYGSVIPALASGVWQFTANCDIPATLYDVFSHRIPVDANPVCIDANVVFESTATIQIEPGIFDFVLLNPAPGDRIWISGGVTYGRHDDFEFQAGNHYTFNVISMLGTETVELEITPMTNPGILGFNIFLNDLTTPYATNVTDMEFVFNNLAVGFHTAAIQAVGAGDLRSNIRPFAFEVKAPEVIAYSPARDETAVALDAPITATFNHATIAAGNLAGITFSPAVTGVSATIEDDNVLTITHDGFDYTTVYTVTIPAGTIAHVTQDISWSFRTVPYCNIPPTPASDFADGFEGPAFPPDCWISHREILTEETSWVRSDASPRLGSRYHARSPQVTAVFTNWLITKPIEVPHTGTYVLRYFDRFIWGAHGGTFDVLVSTTTTDIAAFEILRNVTFAAMPGMSPWRENTISLDAFAGETIYIAFRAHSTAGGGFTAGWDVDDVEVIPLPVSIVSRTPGVNETNVSLTEDIRIVFNQPITSFDTPITTIVLNPAVPNAVASIEDNVLTITHDGFELNQAYAVTIPIGTIVGLNQAVTWTFTTTTTTEIVVVSRTPAVNATNVATDADVVVTFNQPVTAGDLSLIQITPAVANVQAKIDGRNLVISHDGFAFGSVPTIRIPAGTIADFNQEISWSFGVFNPPSAPWFEGFESTSGNALPTLWTRTGLSWQTRGDQLGTGVIPPFSGTRQLTSYRHDGGPAWAFSQGILLNAGTTYKISFAYMAPGNTEENEPDNFRVRVGTGQAVASMTETVFEQITTEPTLVGEWTIARYFFTPTTTGMFHLGFERLHVGHSGGLIRIDDLRIEEAVPYRLDMIASFIHRQIPASQLQAISARAVNAGTSAQTDVVLSATLNGTSIGQSEPVATLASLETTPVMRVVPTSPIAEGQQTLVLTVEGDQDAGTSNTASFTFRTTENVFARDILTAPAASGYGFLEGGTFATVFEVYRTTTLEAVQLFFATRGGVGTIIHTYAIHVRPMIGPMTASSTDLARRTGLRRPGEVNTLDFSDQEPIILEPGRYAVAIHSTGFVDLSLDYSPSGGWYNLNLATGAMDFNLGLGAPGIRMVINDALAPIAPDPAVLTSPANNAQDVSITPTLTWATPTSGGAVVEYFVYLGTSADNLTRVATVPGTSWTVTPALPINTTHYWRVVASNAIGQSAPSPTWTFTTEDPTSIIDRDQTASVRVFPNPVTDGFFYVEANDMRHIEIIDILGRSVMQKNVNSSRERVNIPDLQEKLYFVRITTATGLTLIRIVIQ